ncbi:lipopolysaccharide biosynthesis protein [Streptomyces sp. NBC_00344]
MLAPADRAPDPTGAAGSASMFRNAYALMLSTGVSAALGLGFWLAAARYYSEEAVGQGSAAIAAMRLLASVTATTMTGAVVRYVPRAGRATAPLVLRAYLASTVVVCLGCGVFLLTLGRWGPAYAPLGTLRAGLLFTASCAAWALLTLQDGVLTGLRRAFWVPVGNAVFSTGKLLLLAVFSAALPVLGIFVSWAAAIALSVLPLGWLVFRRLIPRQAAADHDREPPRLREIGRFLAGDSVGALFSLAMINLLPVMVAVRFPPAQNGFFYIAYTVGGTMEYMAINMASSLTAHASHTPGRLTEGVRGALRRMTLLLVPVVALLVAFAPQILRPFGDHYAAHGTTVLRLLAAAALPRVVVELYIGVLRVQGRTGALAVVQGAMCTAVLGSSAVLLGPMGIDGAGWAVLVSMSLTALGCGFGLRAALSGTRARPARRSVGPDRYGTSWARAAAPHDDGGPGSRRAGGPARGRQRSGSGSGGTPDSPLTDVLWLLSGLAAGLFWVPLTPWAGAGRHRPSGPPPLDVLPPLTVIAVTLLTVVYGTALCLRHPRPALLVPVLLTTLTALHTASWFHGPAAHPVSAPWHGAPAFLSGTAGPGSRDVVLRALPVALQLLCLGLLAVTLRSPGTHWRVTAVVMWTAGVAGWVGREVFAAVGGWIVLGLLALAAVTVAAGRRRTAGQRTR